jgi:hypothetical protein
MQEEVQNEGRAEISIKKPFVCPTDPAELAQCDSCQ